VKNEKAEGGVPFAFSVAAKKDVLRKIHRLDQIG